MTLLFLSRKKKIWRSLAMESHCPAEYPRMGGCGGETARCAWGWRWGMPKPKSYPCFAPILFVVLRLQHLTCLRDMSERGLLRLQLLRLDLSWSLKLRRTPSLAGPRGSYRNYLTHWLEIQIKGQSRSVRFVDSLSWNFTKSPMQDHRRAVVHRHCLDT